MGKAPYNVRIVAMDGRWRMQRRHYCLSNRLLYVRDRKTRHMFRRRVVHVVNRGIILSSRRNAAWAQRLQPGV